MIRYIPLISLIFLSACDDEAPGHARQGYQYDPVSDEYVVASDARNPSNSAMYSGDWGKLVTQDPKELRCMAWNIYFEARGTSVKDQIAVAAVTLNRVKSKRFPDTVCEVVFQPHQFSWTVDRRLASHRVEPKAWALATRIAEKALYGELNDPTNGADHYYAPKMIAAPKWASVGYDKVALEGHVYMKLASR